MFTRIKIDGNGFGHMANKNSYKRSPPEKLTKKNHTVSVSGKFYS